MVLGDELLGVGGVMDSVVPFAFSVMLPGCEKHPQVILEAARKMRGILSIFKQPVFACADPELPSASRFMQYIGFNEVMNNVFVWTGE